MCVLGGMRGWVNGAWWRFWVAFLVFWTLTILSSGSSDFDVAQSAMKKGEKQENCWVFGDIGFAFHGDLAVHLNGII